VTPESSGCDKARCVGLGATGGLPTSVFDRGRGSTGGQATSGTRRELYIKMKYILFVVLWFIGAAYYIRYAKAKTLGIVESYLQDNGYELTDYELRNFFRGPFSLASNVQVVYKVVLVDKSGQGHTGWICIGPWLGGIFVDPNMVQFTVSD
jgi:hypothetical protein